MAIDFMTESAMGPATSRSAPPRRVPAQLARCASESAPPSDPSYAMLACRAAAAPGQSARDSRLIARF